MKIVLCTTSKPKINFYKNLVEKFKSNDPAFIGTIDLYNKRIGQLPNSISITDEDIKMMGMLEFLSPDDVEIPLAYVRENGFGTYENAMLKSKGNSHISAKYYTLAEDSSVYVNSYGGPGDHISRFYKSHSNMHIVSFLNKNNLNRGVTITTTMILRRGDDTYSGCGIIQGIVPFTTEITDVREMGFSIDSLIIPFGANNMGEIALAEFDDNSYYLTHPKTKALISLLHNGEVRDAILKGES